MGPGGVSEGGLSERLRVGEAAKPAYTGKKRVGRPKSASLNGDALTASLPVGETRAKVGGRPPELSQIEADIDRLLFRVMSLGGMEDIEDSLRAPAACSTRPSEKADERSCAEA